MAIITDYDILQSQNMSTSEINFDMMTVPPISSYLSPMDIKELNRIATSASLNGKVKEKYRLIDVIMQNRGFKRFSAGTNRVIYKCTTDDRFIAKIAMDRVALNDNPAEFRNQFLLKPFVAKTFEVTPCGTVAFSEKVFPIKNEEEFKEVAGDIYEVIVNKILGEYIMEDIGSKYFMNWGIRLGFGPVLLDYPYLYKLDHNKLYCTKPTENGKCCDGEIDYDKGFNHLVCYKCGKIYPASEVGQTNQKNIKLVRGENTMKITLMYGDKVVATNYETTSTMKKPEPKIKKEETIDMKPELIKIAINEPNNTSTQTAEVVAVNARDNVIKAMKNIANRNTISHNQNIPNYSNSANFNAVMNEYKNRTNAAITNNEGNEIPAKSQEIVLNEIKRIKRFKLNSKFNKNNNQQKPQIVENKIPTFEDIAKYFDPENAAEGYQLKILEIIYKNKGDIVATITKIKQLFNFEYKNDDSNKEEEVETIKQMADDNEKPEDKSADTAEDVIDNNIFEIAPSDDNTTDETNNDVITTEDEDFTTEEEEESDEESEDDYEDDDTSDENAEEDIKDDESEDTDMNNNYSAANGNIVTRDDLDHRDNLDDYDSEFEEYENIPKYRIKSGTGKHIKKFRPNEEEGD